MSQEVKKGPFAALIIASSQKKFLTYSQKPMWFYLLSTKDKKKFNGQSLSQNFFPMRNALDRSYQRSPLSDALEWMV